MFNDRDSSLELPNLSRVYCRGDELGWERKTEKTRGWGKEGYGSLKLQSTKRHKGFSIPSSARFHSATALEMKIIMKLFSQWTVSGTNIAFIRAFVKVISWCRQSTHARNGHVTTTFESYSAYSDPESLCSLQVHFKQWSYRGKKNMSRGGEYLDGMSQNYFSFKFICKAWFRNFKISIKIIENISLISWTNQRRNLRTPPSTSLSWISFTFLTKERCQETKIWNVYPG